MSYEVLMHASSPDATASISYLHAPRVASPAWLGACALGLLCVASGCVRTPRLDEITPSPVSAAAKSSYSVSVAADESLKMMPDDGLGNTVPRDRYVKAVERGLIASGLFARVAPRGQADYDLDVTVFRVTMGAPDGIGYVLVYEVTAAWKLTKPGEATALFDERVSGRGRANFGDAFNGITRNTVARERAARASIAEGINRLSALTVWAPAPS